MTLQSCTELRCEGRITNVRSLALKFGGMYDFQTHITLTSGPILAFFSGLDSPKFTQFTEAFSLVISRLGCNP